MNIKAKTGRSIVARLRAIALAVSLSFSLSSMLAGAQALTAKPDALLSIDLNRQAIVEKVTTTWARELPAQQITSLTAKLMALRADQLLAAHLAGSFDGVLEVLNTAEQTQLLATFAARSRITADLAQRHGVRHAQDLAHLTTQVRAQSPATAQFAALNSSEEKSKAVGDPTIDLVYTPIAPCNLMDTRPGVSPAPPEGGPALNAGYGIRVVQVTGRCGIPAGAKAVASLFTVENIPSTGGVVFAGDAGGAGGAVASWSIPANYASGSSLVPLSAAGAMQLQSAGATQIKIDVNGYFMPPSRNGDGLRVIQNPGASPTVINGAANNTAGNNGETVSGGFSNNAVGLGATVSGGFGNSASGTASTIGGGQKNRTSGTGENTVAGGLLNVITAGFQNGIASGWNNTVSDNYGFIGGGRQNVVTGSTSVIGGGQENTASGIRAFIGGGFGNVASGDRAVIVGGGSNYEPVAGATDGCFNRATNAFDGICRNRAEGRRNFIGAGVGNRTAGNEATVIGGTSNEATATQSFIGGGLGNTAAGSFAVIPGGLRNHASGGLSFVGGRGARTDDVAGTTNYFGAFVWADTQDAGLATSLVANTQPFRSTANNQFAVRARGGVSFKVDATTIAANASDATAGCSLPSGGAASWSCSSDRNLKDGIKAISPKDVLSKVVNLPLSTWQFKGTNRRHLSPMAQDFWAAFGFGEDDRHITASDVSGVALAAVQGINQKLDSEVLTLKSKNSQLEQSNATMQRELAAIKKKLGM